MGNAKKLDTEVGWKILLSDWAVSPSLRGRYEAKSISLLLQPAVAVLLILSGYRIFLQQYLAAILLVVFSLILWRIVRHIVKTRMVRPFMLLSLLLGTAIISYQALTNDPVGPLIASTIFPVLAYFYLGRTAGNLFSGALFGLICLLLFVLNPTIEAQNALSILIAFAMVSLVARMYEITRSKTEIVYENLSNTDELTGASNRRVLDRVLRREISRSHRQFLPLSLCMMDLDDFKEVNDNYGHHLGDMVLKNFCRIVQENIRSTDYLVRYGGDEFIIVTPTTDIKHARMVVEKITAALSNFDFGTEYPIQTSVGIAELKDGDTIETLLNRADKALYEDKVKGRAKPDHQVG
jgi:diguanylate cyclase (GGDEF)-like protein